MEIMTEQQMVEKLLGKPTGGECFVKLPKKVKVRALKDLYHHYNACVVTEHSILTPTFASKSPFDKSPDNHWAIRFSDIPLWWQITNFKIVEEEK